MLLSIMHKVYTCYACGVSFNLLSEVSCSSCNQVACGLVV